MTNLQELRNTLKTCLKCKRRTAEDNDLECKVCERKFHVKQLKLMAQGKRKRINEI